MMVDNLDKRKKRILQAIIQEHVISAAPIGSRTLSKKYEFEVSPATIRNEMSDLEDMGFLEQPHTSAGRVPSDLGYRFYVDEIIQAPELKFPQMLENIEDNYRDMQSIQDIITGTARMLSKMTRYTALVSEPSIQESKLQKVQVLPVAGKSLLIVMITDTGIVHNKIIKTEQDFTAKKLHYINQFLSDKLENKELAKLDPEYLVTIEEQLLAKIDISKKIFTEIYQEFKGINKPEDLKVYLGGTSYILDQPEFNDIERLKKVLNLLDQEKVLGKLINNNLSGADLEVKIGHENELEDMKNCSLVVATYHISDKAIGKIGVLGPTRMEYHRVISAVDLIADILGSSISKVSR